MNIKDLIAKLPTLKTNVPNSVSGDGKVFVRQLKECIGDIIAVLKTMNIVPTQVSGIRLSEINRIIDNVRLNDIKVEWSVAGIEDYAKAEIWHKTGSGEWQKDGEAEGKSNEYILQNVERGLTYTVKVAAVNSKGVVSDLGGAPTATIKIVGVSYIPATPTQFTLTWDNNGALWQWKVDDDGSHIDFFELRLDGNPGVWDNKCLGRTRELYSRATPGTRAGTAYLYVRNIFGEYSQPATHQFNKAKPVKPAAPVVSGVIDGVTIKMASLPQSCTGYKLHIINTKTDGTQTEGYFDSVNDEYTYSVVDGSVSISYAFVDTIGEGEWSDVVNAKVKDLLVDTDNIKADAVAEPQIADGAVTTRKLQNGIITLNGERAIAGGAALLNEKGLTITDTSGGAVQFNSAGASYKDAQGNVYMAARRILVGTASNGAKVKFAHAWGSVPVVLCSPRSMELSASSYNIVCKAKDVTTEGFTVECYSAKIDGSATSTGSVTFICIDTNSDYTIE
jgi:hypothetical protein